MENSSNRRPSVRVFKHASHPILDVFGPTVQFLATPEEADDSHCVMKGVIPPGGVVPLHSHTGVECFLMLSGQQEVLIETDGHHRWTLCEPGDFIRVPSEARHAFRNLSDEPAVSLVTTTEKLGRFFQEVGRPVSPHDAPMPPTPEAMQHFVVSALRAGYWLATPEENASVGLVFG